MPFNHNDHYHPLLLSKLPPGPGTALDVGCGTGRFARRLAAAGMEVDAVDASGLMVEAAKATGSPGPGKITYRQTDITTERLPVEHYSYISCIASLHHISFASVEAFRNALVPGGVLVVLGLARPSRPADYARWLAAAPVNVAARLIVYAGEQLNGGSDTILQPPIKEEYPALSEVRRDAARLLPGSTVKTLLFWRYLLAYRKQNDDHPL